MPEFSNNTVDVIIPEKKNIQAWGENIITYAISSWLSNRSRKAHYFQNLRNSYNGFISDDERSAIDKMYGQANRMPFHDFKLSRNKLDTITGEFLLRDLRAHPIVINKDIRNEKQERKNLLMGMYLMRDRIAQAEKLGMDITGGVQVPQSMEEIEKMTSYKTKAEIFFSKACNVILTEKNFKASLYSLLQEYALTSEIHGRVYIDATGKDCFMPLSPEDAIFEELKNDPFCKNSTFKGCRMWMTKPQILKMFDLTTDEKNLLDGWFNGTSNTITPGMFQPGKTGSSKAIAVFHIEWKGLEAWPLKNEKNGEKEFTSILSHDYYNRNRSKINNEVKKGKYTLDVRFKERLFNGYRIGDTIYKNIEEAKNTRESYNSPYEAPYTYINVLFNTVGGERVPFFALMEEAKRQYNWVRNCINRELSKFKGMAFAYDRAMLPVDPSGKPVSMNYILWRIVNDGVIDVSSAAEHNFSGKDIQVTDILKASDLGATTSLETLIRLGYDLERLVDRLSSVNDNRQGLTSASETATNANNNIVGSRTITEPLMYFFDLFIGEIIKSRLECYRVRSLIDPESVASEIGEDAELFFEDMDVSVCDLGVSMENTRAIERIRERIQKFVEVSLNAGELAIPDAFAVEASSTVAEAQDILQKSWNKIQQLKQQMEQQKADAQAAAEKKRLDTKIEFREDGQRHEMEKIQAKGLVKAAEKAQDASNKAKLQKTV